MIIKTFFTPDSIAKVMFCSMSALALNKLNFKFDRFSVLFQLTYTQGEKKELGLDPGPLAKSCSGDEESDWK